MQIFLLCLIAVGFLTTKAHIIDERARSSLTDLILSVFLPCNIVASFFGTSRSQLPSLGIMLIISLGTMALGFALAHLFFRKAGTEQKKVLLYAALIPNASLLGNPLIESIYGTGGLAYVAAYLIPLRMALWSLGLAIFTVERGSLRKIVFHPCLIGTYIGLIVMITGFSPPVLISRLVLSLGNCTTPISMMVVGSILGLTKIKYLFSRITISFSFLRLVLIPLMVMGILLLFRPDPLITGISVVLGGTPAGITTVILADKYGSEKELASKIVFVTVLLSMITIPALVWLLH
ncbi:MAG: AEC family transporter [Treponema sp.]|nr:AEC family transporter [Treponema sp.]